MLIGFSTWSNEAKIAFNPDDVSLVEQSGNMPPACNIYVGSNKFVVNGRFEDVLDKLNGADNS